MKADTEIILLIAFFFFGFGIASAFGDAGTSLTFDNLLPAATTLVAAFLGAGYAFRLKEQREIRAEKERNRVSGNMAIFQLMRMQNRLLNYRKQFLEPFRHEDIAFLAVPPSDPLSDETFRLDFVSLTFLIEVADPNLLGKISVCEQKFHSVCSAIEKRSNMHSAEVQPRLEASGLYPNTELPLQGFEDAVGPRVTLTMKMLTTQIYQMVDETISFLGDCQSEMSKVLERVFPQERIIRTAVANADDNAA